MARIREAEIGEDGEIRIVRHGGGGGVFGVVLALVLVIGGVWAFDAVYGDQSDAIEISDAVSN